MKRIISGSLVKIRIIYQATLAPDGRDSVHSNSLEGHLKRNVYPMYNNVTITALGDDNHNPIHIQLDLDHTDEAYGVDDMLTKIGEQYRFHLTDTEDYS